MRETVEFEYGDPDCALHSSSILESNVDGSGAHTLALVGGNYEDYDPVWSPRGNLVAFVERGSLVVSRPDGTSRRALMRVGGGGIVDGVSGGGNIAWSPDGRRIAAVSDVGAGALVVVPLHGRVQTMRLPRGGFPENINFDFGDFSDPVGAWSPDGRRLLYAADNRLCTVTHARARCVSCVWSAYR